MMKNRLSLIEINRGCFQHNWNEKNDWTYRVCWVLNLKVKIQIISTRIKAQEVGITVINNKKLFNVDIPKLARYFHENFVGNKTLDINKNCKIINLITKWWEKCLRCKSAGDVESRWHRTSVCARGKEARKIPRRLAPSYWPDCQFFSYVIVTCGFFFHPYNIIDDR